MPRWKNNALTAADVQQIKRQAVLKEAARAFGRRGFHGTSLDDVARALQVSKGTLYNYVRDKQEILAELYRIAMALGLRAFEIGEREGGTGGQQLHKVLTTYIRLLTEEIGACSALLEIDELRPADKLEAVKSRDAFQRRFMELIRKGVKDGSIREIEDPKLAIYTFMGAVNWLLRWYSLDGHPGTDERLAESMASLLLEGIVAPQPR